MVGFLIPGFVLGTDLLLGGETESTQRQTLEWTAMGFQGISTANCDCGEVHTMDHTVNHCDLTALKVGLTALNYCTDKAIQ